MLTVEEPIDDRAQQTRRAFRTMLSIVGVFAIAMLAIAAQPAPRQSAGFLKERYLSPLEMTFFADGRLLFVVCQDSDEVRVVDVESTRVVEHPGRRMPRGIAMSADGRRIYVTNAWSDTVSVIDTATLEVVQTLPTGFEPTGVVLDREGTTLYVANRLSGDVSVIDLKTGQETKRLLAGRGASYLALSPDGKWIYCTHIYPNPEASGAQPQSEITVIDTSGRLWPSASTAQCSRRISHGDIGGRQPGRCRPATTQESHPTRARRTWLGVWRFAHIVWRRRRRNSPDSDR